MRSRPNSPALALHTFSRHWERVPRLTDRDFSGRFAPMGQGGVSPNLCANTGPRVLALCRSVLLHEQDAEYTFQAPTFFLVPGPPPRAASASVARLHL